MIPVARPLIGEEEIKEVVEVLRSGIIVQGRKVAEFEERFSKYVGAKYGIAVSNGTAALDIALHAASMKRFKAEFIVSEDPDFDGIEWIRRIWIGRDGM